jgi:hypothetical protein
MAVNKALSKSELQEIQADVEVIHYLRQMHGTGWRGLDAAFGFKAPKSKDRGRRLTGFRTMDFHRKHCGCNI